MIGSACLAVLVATTTLVPPPVDQIASPGQFAEDVHAATGLPVVLVASLITEGRAGRIAEQIEADMAAYNATPREKGGAVAAKVRHESERDRPFIMRSLASPGRANSEGMLNVTGMRGVFDNYRAFKEVDYPKNALEMLPDQQVRCTQPGKVLRWGDMHAWFNENGVTLENHWYFEDLYFAIAFDQAPAREVAEWIAYCLGGEIEGEEALRILPSRIPILTQWRRYYDTRLELYEQEARIETYKHNPQMRDDDRYEQLKLELCVKTLGRIGPADFDKLMESPEARVVWEHDVRKPVVGPLNAFLAFAFGRHYTGNPADRGPLRNPEVMLLVDFSQPVMVAAESNTFWIGVMARHVPEAGAEGIVL